MDQFEEIQEQLGSETITQKRERLNKEKLERREKLKFWMGLWTAVIGTLTAVFTILRSYKII